MKTDSIREIKAALVSSHWLITRRLAWLYALSSSILLIFASGFLYWILIATLEQEDEQFLISRVHVLDTILQTGNSKALEHEIAEENIGFPSSQYLTYSRILDESGRTLYEAPG